MSNLLEKASILLTPTAYDDGKILSVKPIDGSGDFQFTRNSSATRVNSQGLIEDMQILSSNLVSNGDFSQEGSELITNGDFATDSDWTLGNGSYISEGYLILPNTGTALQTGTFIDTMIRFDVQGSGTIGYRVNTGVGYQQISLPQTIYLTTGSSGGRVQFSNTSGNEVTIDNVSVKEVGQDWTLDAGWSISEGLASRTNTGAYGAMYQNCLESGKKYKATIKITSITSQAFFGVRLGTNYILQGITQPGTYTAIGVSTSATLSIMGNPTFAGSIDSIKIIEITDDTNLPRIDYSPYSGAGTCGHWLFEPQSTNLIPYSEDLTNNSWSKFNSTASSSTIVNPEGTNGASLYTCGNYTGSNQYFRINPNATYNNDVDYSYSMFVKYNTFQFCKLTYVNYILGEHFTAVFDIINGTVTDTDTNGTPQNTSSKIEDFGNNWFRISISAAISSSSGDAMNFEFNKTPSGTPTFTTFFGRIDQTTTTNDKIYVYGAQLEQKSYPTSYIPTSGSAVTRNQEAAFGSGNSSLINSTEGTLYAEIAALADDGTFRLISLLDPVDNTNRLDIGFSNTNGIYANVRTSGNSKISSSTVDYNIGQYYKIAIKWSNTEGCSFYLDGVEIQTGGNTFFTTSDFTSLQFRNAFDNPLYGKTKCVAVFKEALTDDELECLTSDETSFSSFNALALANNYTII